MKMMYSDMRDSGRSSYDEMSEICTQISIWLANQNGDGNGDGKDPLIIKFKPSINPFVIILSMTAKSVSFNVD